MRAERRVGPTVRVRVQERAADAVRSREDRVIAEEPMEIRLTWPGTEAHRVAVTMRTPGADFELAAGFTIGEGIAGFRDHIASVAYCTDHALSAAERFNVTTVTLSGPPRHDPAVRHLAQTSACGVCGKDSLAAVREFGGRPVDTSVRIAPDLLGRLPDLLQARQELFGRTGAVHAAGIFDPTGTPLVVREDVGRHNAVDKVVGAVALGTGGGAGVLPPSLDQAVLCTSARAGFEIVQKAVMAGIPVVAAVGAASSMAVDCAREYGVTLAGFVRAERFVVYTGGDRICG